MRKAYLGTNSRATAAHCDQLDSNNRLAVPAPLLSTHTQPNDQKGFSNNKHNSIDSRQERVVL